MRGRRPWLEALLVALLVLPMTTPARPQATGKAVFEAVARGDIAALDRLIATGAPLDATDAAGQTPLLLAVQNNDLDAATRLIVAGADINAQAANRDTPWLLAGAQGRTAMLRLMLPKGPDFSIRNRFGGNALIPACERAHVETVAFLVTTRIDVNHINDLGWTCLLEIVILGDGGPRYVEVTKLVLGAGANLDIADRDGVTPLQHARRRGQREVAALIEAASKR
jgi:ankyrin repeat protein